MVQAERRLRELRLKEKALHREYDITMEVERDLYNPIVEPARDELWDFLEQTPPRSIVGAAAKLRFLVDNDIGVLSDVNDGEGASLSQVAELIERLAENAAPER